MLNVDTIASLAIPRLSAVGKPLVVLSGGLFRLDVAVIPAWCASLQWGAETLGAPNSMKELLENPKNPFEIPDSAHQPRNHGIDAPAGAGGDAALTRLADIGGEVPATGDEPAGRKIFTSTLDNCPSAIYNVDIRAQDAFAQIPFQ